MSEERNNPGFFEMISKKIGENWRNIKSAISSGLEGLRGKEKEEKTSWEFQINDKVVFDRMYQELFIFDVSESENFGDMTFNYRDDHSINISIFDRTETRIKSETVDLNDVEGRLILETKSLIISIDFTNISKEADRVKSFGAKVTARKKDQT